MGNFSRIMTSDTQELDPLKLIEIPFFCLPIQKQYGVHLRSIAVHTCKTDTHTQLCKNCMAQVRLTVLPVDKVVMFLFLKTT